MAKRSLLMSIVLVFHNDVLYILTIVTACSDTGIHERSTQLLMPYHLSEQ